MMRSSLFLFLLMPLCGLALLSPIHAEEWIRIHSESGDISALFPSDIKANPQTQTDKTLAGKVTSVFGEHRGDGILLAASAAHLPRVARASGEKAVLKASKKTFLTQAKGKEISFERIKVSGKNAMELRYKGDAYQGKGQPYQGRAVFLLLNNRVYIINSVISKANTENKAMEKKVFKSITL
ncbi:MAG: hypothetical protein L3J39_13760 [Verrucomicrobiales bacterium]|nr:hypothetical protein [Verrucomicrobiales bacterium]